MMDWLPAHECELSLTHNSHKSNYETAAQAIENDAQWYADDDFVSPKERQRCIDANEIWTLQWYPNTPIGFFKMHASTLEALAEYCRSLNG